MTDKTIISLIRKLNQNKAQGLIHLRPLSPTVDFAKVWLKQAAPTKDWLYQKNLSTSTSLGMKMEFTLLVCWSWGITYIGLYLPNIEEMDI